MTDIELLREAARLMRERANGVYPPELTWGKHVMAHSGTALDHALSWSPSAALAVAAWLDAEAGVHERVAIADVAVRAVTDNEFRVNALESTLPQALAVARAYLRPAGVSGRG